MNTPSNLKYAKSDEWFDPTGSGAGGWDTDGSYGDWYGGHELAHSFGR